MVRPWYVSKALCIFVSSPAAEIDAERVGTSLCFSGHKTFSGLLSSSIKEMNTFNRCDTKATSTSFSGPAVSTAVRQAQTWPQTIG